MTKKIISKGLLKTKFNSNPSKVHKNKNPFKYFNYVPIRHTKLQMTKKIISKGLLKTKFNSNPSKVHNYHFVKVSQKNISHLIL
jgi:hypothetical protein